MKLSVVIPVYNAEKYVKRAVESALQQDECGEIILVEDNSPDNAFEICKNLANQYDNVYLYTHKNRQNKGPGPSRNLGASKTKYNYMAFLDADDFYMPKRFAKAVKILSLHPELDGIYEPVGSTFENDEAQKRYFNTHQDSVAMVQKVVDPENLYETLISGKYGYIHPNGLLIKRDAFFKAGMYPDLALHQDMIFHYQLALKCNLAAGETNNPVSMRLLHLENRITKPGTDFAQSRYIAFEYLIGWMKKNNIEENRIRLAKIKYLQNGYRLKKRQGNYFHAAVFYLMLKFYQKIAKDGTG